MKRKIVTIDEDKCNGCGLCAAACHEGALQMVDGKARLVSESLCDGLGACLPECPAGAIRIEEREAEAFDEGAVKEQTRKGGRQVEPLPETLACGCPGTHARTIARPAETRPAHAAPAPESQLRQWPCQIKLVPVNAPYFEGAHLLVAADCTAYAYADTHREFMRGRITLIGCPKLDQADYAEKLAAILTAHDIQSITVLRMEVPCCGGIVESVRRALQTSGKVIPWRVATVGTDGTLLEG
ncbi:MAG: ATP-binding protein [Bacteroidota bacterium]